MDVDELIASHPNWIYYCEVGNGEWAGSFDFSITHWNAFWKEKSGSWNKMFSILNHLNQKITGNSRISSVLEVHPNIGPAGTITNLIFIKKLGITLYKLEERYVLDPEGTNVYVHSNERLGPVPFLFQRIKKHPAKVLAKGGGAKYLDMPILGTIWQGDYSVNEKQDGIHAKLYCQWAEAHENISKKKLGLHYEPMKFAYPSTIKDVIECLEKYRDWYDQTKDPRATFTHAYLVMTKLFEQQIPLTNFKDPAWILQLDVLFAQQYLKAINEYDLGILDHNGWKNVFEQIMGKKTSVLEELLLCMASHIIQDLPMALLNSGWKDRPEEERISDFHLANEILGHAINKIQKEVAHRYNPILKWLDRFGDEDDEILTNYGIRVSRGMAWYNTVRYIGNPTEVSESLVRSVGDVVKQIIHPPFSLAFFLRLFRFASKLTRKWPAKKQIVNRES